MADKDIFCIGQSFDEAAKHFRSDIAEALRITRGLSKQIKDLRKAVIDGADANVTELRVLLEVNDRGKLVVWGGYPLIDNNTIFRCDLEEEISYMAQHGDDAEAAALRSLRDHIDRILRKRKNEK